MPDYQLYPEKTGSGIGNRGDVEGEGTRSQ